MSDVFTAIIISVFTNGGVLALFIWVFKILFEKSLEKKTKIIEKEIDLLNKKNLYQFSKIYDEQAQVIKDTYSELVTMMEQVTYLTYYSNLLEGHPELFDHLRIPEDGNPIKWKRYLDASLSERKEDLKAKELKEITVSALNNFKKRRIYFSKIIADEIERLMSLILFIASEFTNVTYRDPKYFEPMIAEEVISHWKKSIQVSNQLFPILEYEFRKHLGIEN